MMKKWITLATIFIALFTSNLNAQRAFLDQGLINALSDSGPNEFIPIFLTLEDAADMVALKQDFIQKNIPVSRRAQLVMGALKSKANDTQPDLISEMAESGFAYTDLQRFWISNSIALRANAEMVQWLANRPDIDRIILNEAKYGVIKPVKGESALAKSEGGIEPGLAAIGAPEMWALGYTGLGRIAMTFDTGVWPDHPALSEHFLPNLMPLSSTWFGLDSDVPADKAGSHGTHVSGTMVGLEVATADTIGVAPGGYIIATDPIGSTSETAEPVTQLISAYQWAFNPDGDESTSDDIPDVINNSWGFVVDFTDPDPGIDLCPDAAIPLFLAIEAAGIANVYSAGNDGPNASTMGILKNINLGLVNSFSVAAVNGNSSGPQYNVANFSSRGPSACGGEGSLLIKPEVSAPGVNVRSAVDNGGYDLKSGTSMAAPHVSGAVLLLKEAFPYLSGEDILLALYFTAIDQGIPGEDNTYGMGMINVKDAYDYLAEDNDPVPPASSAFDLQLTQILNPGSDLACDPELNDVIPVIEVRNNGTTTAEGISIVYTITGEAEQTYDDPQFLLEPGNTVEIELPSINSPESGSKELHIQIVPAEGEYNVLNNNRVRRWKKLPIHIIDSGNFTEDFESGINSDVWTVVNPDGNITWDTANVIQSNGEMGYAAWMGFFNYSPIASQKDLLITPWIKTTWIDVWYYNPNVTFDLYYRKRNSNAFTQDTLVILAHVPCYLSEEPIEIFRKGGVELYTNPNLLSNAFPENEDDWVEISLEIDLVQLLGSGGGEFYLEFQGINRRSNNLLIDNINVSWPETINTTEPPVMEVGLYPNPTRDAVAISWNGNQPNANLRMHDVQGRIVAEISQIANGEMVALPELSRGVYLAAVSFEDGYTKVLKLVIQ